MRKYSFKVGLIFIVSYIFLFFVVSFFYSLLTDKFYEEKNASSLLTINKTIALKVESNLTYDYTLLSRIINQLNSNDDMVDQLKTNDEVKLLNSNYIGFGYVNSDNYLIEGVNYYFNNDYLNTEYYNQNISFFSFADAFTNSDNAQLLCFFKVGNIIAYFDAYEYLEPLFIANNTPNNYYFIISKDGFINFQKDRNSTKNKIFENYLRADNNEYKISDIMDDLYLGKSNIVQLKIFNEQSFFAYSPLSKDISSLDLFVVHTFSKSEVMGSTQKITTTLLIMSIIQALIAAIAIFFIYDVIQTKNDDIELSRLIHYYTKPFLLRINRKGKIVFSNRTFKNNVKNFHLIKTIYDLNLEVHEKELLAKIKKQNPFTSIFINGEEKIYIRFIPLKSGTGYYLLGENITERENDYINKRNMALYNRITKLPNMNFLILKLKEIFENKKLLQKKNSVVSINILSFKNINLLLGYKIGDETIVKLAEYIKKSLEGYNATLYNTEADNFVALFEDLNDYKSVIAWAEDFLTFMKKPVDVQRNILVLDIKIGIFHIEDNKYQDLNYISAFENSVLALRKAKSSRRVDYVVYDIGLGQFQTREQIMESDLITAIENNEFVMFLQPQYNNLTNTIVGAEALIRWNNPKYRLESPAHFIELAEQNSLIIEIGRFVMNETFRIAKEIEKYNIHISINISPVQILQAGFVNEIIAIYDKYQLKPNSIAIEITETFLMTSFDIVIEKLKLLKEHGFSIHLDDFGTGYSSMLYLKELPIDTIKIDKEFILNVNTDRYTRAIVSKIIALAKSLDLSVIAEGVEDEKQNHFLIKNGCNIIQGHLISRAISKDDCVKLIRDFNEKPRIKN